MLLDWSTNAAVCHPSSGRERSCYIRPFSREVFFSRKIEVLFLEETNDTRLHDESSNEAFLKIHISTILGEV